VTRLLLVVGLLAVAASGVLGDALSNARQLIAEGKHIEAEAALHEAADNPDLAPEAYYTWYQSLSDRGEAERAARKLRMAAELAVDRADWWLELGRFLSEIGQTDEAMTHYIQALGIDPAYGDAHSALAKALLKTGRVAEAEAQLREAVRTSPTSDAHRADLAALLLKTGRTHDALTAVQRGLAASPQSAALQMVLGSIYEQMRETSKAIGAYEAAARLNPRAPDAFVSLGRVHEAKDDFKSALRMYRRAAALAPKDPVPNTAIAWLYLEDVKKPKAALGSAKRAVARAPEGSAAQAAYGWALYNLKREAEGEEALLRAAELEPVAPRALYYLGIIANARGDSLGAVDWLRKAVAEGAGTQIGQRATELLSKLEATSEATAGDDATLKPTEEPEKTTGG